MERYISIDNAIKIVTKAMEGGEYHRLIDVSNALKEATVADLEEAEKWYHEYHRIKDELRYERMCHQSTEKLADHYCAECKRLGEMLDAAIAGQETLQKETSKWVKECEELQERLIEYEKDLARQIFGKIEKIIGERKKNI